MREKRKHHTRLFHIIACLVLLLISPSTNPSSSFKAEINKSLSETSIDLEGMSWYLENFTKTASFFASLQGPDGGEMEAEDNPFENTDNTLESIWVWCRYYELTGDNQYYQNVLRAWNYSIAHPAWLEDDSGKIYSSSWALAAEQRFRSAYNDWTYAWYANASLQFISNETGWEPALFTAVTKVHIRGWAAGNVYRYSIFTGNETARILALELGNLTMASIEANPSYLSTEGWALAGGTSMWGIWQSTMQEFPNASWMLTYAPFLKKEVATPGVGGGRSQVGWEAWYAGGHLAVWDITGADSYYLNFLNITDRQMAADGDDDGGLPTNYGEPDNTDESWVSSYRAYMILDEFNRMPGGNPPRNAEIQKAEVVGSDVLLNWSLSPDDGGGEGDVFVYEIYYAINTLVCDFGSSDFTLLGVVFAGNASYTHEGVGSNSYNYIYYLATRDYQGWRNESSIFAGKCSIPLQEGMNLISIPFRTASYDVSYIFKGVPLSNVWRYDPTDPIEMWSSYNSSKPFNDLRFVDEAMGIWVDVNQPTTLSLAGVFPKQYMIPIRSGWNLIGVPMKTNITIDDFLVGIAYDRAEVFEPSSSIYCLKSVNNTYTIHAGDAVWVHALADGLIQIEN